MVRLLCLCVIAGCILSGNAVFANEQAADILYEKGVSDMLGKKYQDAEKAFLTAIEVYANHSRSYFKLGELHEITNKPQDAIKNYNMALTILLEKESLNADDARLRKEIELALQRTDQLGTKYKAATNECINDLLALAEEAKKEKRADLLEKIYADVLYLDPQNTNALKGRKDLIASSKPAEAVKTPPSMKDFRDIFNGKDLDSWKKEYNTPWDVKNGEIFISTPQGDDSNLTYKDKSFEDKYSIAVKFKGEYTDISDRKLYGVGIYFGFVNLDKNYYLVRVEENELVIHCCEVVQNAAGPVRNYGRIKAFSIENYKTNDWNVLIVRVNRQDVTVFFNDVPVCENLKLEDKTSGKIGIMAGAGSVRLKEIRVMGK